MSNTLYNLVRAYTATIGTGPIIPGAAIPGCFSFQSSCSDGDIITYGIADGVGSEVGRGRWSSLAQMIARLEVYASTNGGNPLSLSGNAQIFITISAEDMRGQNPSGAFTLATGVNSTTVTIPGLRSTSTVVYSPTPGANSIYAAAMIVDLLPISQSADTLVFDHPPTSNVCQYNYIARL